MNPLDARGMAALMFWAAPRSRREAIARHMVATSVNALHAHFELYGRSEGRACLCAPCAAGASVVRLLGQAREEVSAR